MRTSPYGIEEESSVQRWLISLSNKTNSRNTRDAYLRSLSRYCSFLKLSPDKIIKDRKKDLKSDDEAISRKHEDKALEFFAILDKKFSRKTASLTLAAVRSFYNANYLSLLLSSPSVWSSHVDVIPSIDDIKKIVQHSDSALQRAVILFSTQSGQRVGILTALRCGIFESKIEKNEILPVHIQADLRNSAGDIVNKGRQEYTFFIGRDACSALSVYLKERRIRGEVIEEDSFLFVTGKRFRGEYMPLNQNAINNLIKRAAIRAGLMRSVTGKSLQNRAPIHHHCLRKFWQTTMEQSGVAKPWYEYMMGHKLGQLDRVYSQPSIEQLKSAYMKAEPLLSISRIKEDEEEMKKSALIEILKAQAKAFGVDASKITIE